MKKAIALAALLACLGLSVLSGCGNPLKPATADSAPSRPTTTPEGVSMSKLIEGYNKLSDDEVAAAMEALRCARDCNIGSSFKACSLRCAEGWACVTVREIECPAEEAVAFDVYVKKGAEGKWEVVQTGSGLKQEDIPGAPAGIF